MVNKLMYKRIGYSGLLVLVSLGIVWYLNAMFTGSNLTQAYCHPEPIASESAPTRTVDKTIPYIAHEQNYKLECNIFDFNVNNVSEEASGVGDGTSQRGLLIQTTIETLIVTGILLAMVVAISIRISRLR